MRVISINNPQQKIEIKSNQPAFKAIHNGYWKEEALRILERSPEEIKELGEYFHKSTKDELVKVARRSNFLGIRKNNESTWALNVLNMAIEQVVKTKAAMEKTLEELTKKGTVTAEETEIVSGIKKSLKSLDDKFDSRHKEFFQEVEPLSENDIAYFDRHKWDY